MSNNGTRLPQYLAAHQAALACRRFIRLPGDRQAVGRPLWIRATAAVMTVVMYFAPAVLLADQAAHAAPIVDPRAPVTFQPSVTQTSTGVPVVNIATPNSNGISANQYSSFNIDNSGLVLNNSLVAGTPLLGGSLGANPNLNGRPATTILNQVTSTAPSTLAGPLEVFGSPASVIVSNPNGVNVNGLSLTNAPGLVITTGVPQFISGPGGSPASFANAGAVAYNISSGNITINGPAGANGQPGAGIEGTVGNIDLIGQSVNVNAPLYANDTVNVITGNQTVTPTAAGASGTTYGTSNVVAGQPGAVAVDASKYGSVTAGQIFIVSTAAGEGVNMQGPLAGTAGNVSVNSNGDIVVGQTFAQQNVNLAGAGNVSITDKGLANANYSVSAGGDINATGSVSAGQDVSLTAGNNLNAASVAANGQASLVAGNSMTLGSLSANAINLQTGTGDLTVNSALTAPGTIAAKAGRDLTINGAVQGGSTVALTGARNATVNGSVASVGDTTITAQTGSASVTGNVQSNGALTTTAAQNVALGGTVQAQGPVAITATNGSITGQGNVASSNDAVSLTAGQSVQTGGSLQAGTNLSVSAGTNAVLGGTVTAPGAVTVTAGQDATLAGDATAGSTLTVAADNSTAIDGTVASVGDMALSAAAGTLTTTGNVVTLGALSATGQQGVNLGGTVYSQGNASIGSGAGAVSVAGSLTSPGTIAINAAQDATVAGAVHSGSDTGITAGGNVALNGGLEADGTGNATVKAGGSITGSGAVNVANNTTLTAGNSIALSGAVQTGNDLTATAAQNVTTGAVTAVGNAFITATNGSATLGGDVLTGGDLNVTAGTDVSAPGSVQALGDLNLSAKGGNLTAAGPVSAAGNATLNAGQSLALNGATTVQGNTTLTGTNVTTQDLSVGGNLSATAAQNLDTSAGTLAVNGTATLTGASVTTGNALVGGTYSATGTQSLTTTGTGAYLGDATLAGGTVTNTGTQMAAGTLGVTGTTVTNSGALSGLVAANLNATDLVNSGTVYGPSSTITVANSTTNSGGLMATNTLTLTTGTLDNTNGLIFAGDVNNPASGAGDVSVTVNGPDGSYNNTNGQILGFNSVTLDMKNETLDPLSAPFGSVNGGNEFNLSVAAITNSGTWTLPDDTAVSVTASQGINNTGTIDQASGTLALNSAVTNSGTITAQDLTINGSLANAAGATVQGNDAFTLNGSGTNAGTVEALNQLTISGSSYDNTGGTTQAGTSSAGTGNMNINLSGDLTNSGGTITATNDLSLTAARVINSGATAAGTTTTTTTTVDNPALLDATVIGTEEIMAPGQDVHVPLTLGGLLSPAGQTAGVDFSVVNQQGINNIPVNAATSTPVASTGDVTFQFVLMPWGSSPETGATAYLGQLYIQDGTVPTNGTMLDGTTPWPSITVALPTVTETTTTTGSTTDTSVIAAGHNLNLTAQDLQNTGGTVSAGNDANVNVQSLENGAATFSSTVTDTVDAASLNAFLSVLSPYTGMFGGTTAIPGTLGVRGSGDGQSDGSEANFTFSSPSSITVPSVTSSTTVQGQAGQIVAGHNVNLSGGDLTNAGTIAAANDVNITANSFTNQGTNTGTTTTTAGCAAGYSAGCSSLSTSNPNSTTYAYQQINANVTAGTNVVIAANTVSNTYGNIVAGKNGNVVIGGAGTSMSDGATGPTNLTQATSVTNTSGAIAAGNDVDINAGSLVNTIAAPVQIHQNYGSATPFTGCSSNCEAYVDVQSAAPATITANHDVNLTANTFANTGSLVMGLNNVTINAANSASNDNQYLHAYWSSDFVHSGTNYPAFGCANDPALCQQLYGSGYSSSAAQDPAGLPSSVGLPDFVPGTIQAGNTATVNSPTLTNTGNITSQTVNLTGSTLVNGLTNPNVYTPPPAVAGQVITLGPPAVPSTAQTTVNAAGLVTNLAGQPVSVNGAAGLPSNSPIGVTTVGKPTAPAVGSTTAPGGTTVTTIGGQQLNVTYLLNSPASAVTGDLSPAALLAKLPASLQPDTTQFYYDPYTQAQQVEQAALQATGQSSFYALPSQTDSATQTTVNYQDTAALYGAALQYAEQNNVALGTQLSQAQLDAINAPMLWYVEETVPEPGCTATGNGACPTVQALVPEVLLPQNFAQVNADGEITGTNVALNYANSILNTGSITADNLTVNTASLTNEQRSTNVGTIYQELSNGVLVTTGTVVQQGGFMAAANYNLQVDSLNQIGGALEQLNADGSANDAATSQLLANLKGQLGGNFTQSSVSNDLNTTFIADPSDFGLEIFAMVAAVVASIVTYGAASAAIGAVAGATEAAGDAAIGAAAGGEAAMASAAAEAGGTLMAATAGASAGLGNIVLSASLAGMAGSMTSQLVGTGTINWGSVGEAGLVGALTAGLTNGITYNADAGLGFTTGATTAADPSLASLAGAQSIGNTMVPQAGASAAATLPEQALAIAGEATIQAGVQAGIEGGSFLTALKNSAVSDFAAAGAYAIGSTTDPLTLENIAEHAALGCAAGAATGGGCGGGAVGAATSAALTPFVLGAIDPTGEALSPEQTAVVTALAMLSGAGAAGALGQNADTAAAWAENEALNNDLASLLHIQGAVDAAKSLGSSAAAWISSSTGLYTLAMLSMNADIGGAAGEEEGLIESAESAFAAEEAGIASRAAAATATGSGTTTLYRAVSPEEFASVMNSGQFSFGPAGSEMKQFGFNMNEVLNYANFQTDYAAIVRADIPTSLLGSFNVSNAIDPFIFKSGVLTINGQSGLNLFNSLVKNVGHAY